MKSLGTVVYLNLATAIVAGIAFWTPEAAQAQTTSADLRGSVSTEDGAPISGAEVQILHVPSGTTSIVTSTASGQFFSTGLRVGGPYQITVTADTYQGAQLENIFLQPGSQDPLRFALPAMAVDLDAIQVTGSRLAEAVVLNNGVGSSFSARDIANQPTTDRDVIGTLLIDPLAQSDGVGNLSVGGVNPRFNGFSIDGSLQQDDFGLTTGTYATSRSPINLDIVESATLVASDYSVTAQGFTGGLVNVITKSGGNEFDGGVYYAYKDDGMVGDEIDGQDFDAGVFEEEEYGFYLSGPIIKDKLFFLVSYDEYENAAPVDFANFDEVNGIEPGFYDTARQIILDTYGYDPLSRPLVANVPETSERIYLKIDWNITDFQRLSVSYQDSEESDVSVDGSEFESAWYDIPLTVEAINVDWFSDWTATLSTNFRLNYKENTRGQICRGGTQAGEIVLNFEDLDDIAGSPLEGLLTEPGEFIGGCDRFRHANTFDDERLQLFGKADWFLGDHLITFGLEYEQYDLDNLFVASSRGSFEFTSYDDLINRQSDVFYSNVTTNNALDGAAIWGYDKWTAFIGDRWSINADFELNFGLRYESYSQSDSPAFSQTYFDLYGVDTSNNLDGLDILLPRVGFLWTPWAGASLSGGFGLYAGGAPQVWVSNAFQAPVVGASGDFSGVTLTDIPQELLDQVASGTPLPLD
ncbi:MAG: carboxypeptidase regulatory-like domain-containing protein, partial [Pseudomonadota bacterium]